MGWPRATLGSRLRGDDDSGRSGNLYLLLVNWLTEKRVALFALIIRLAQEQRWNVTPLMQNANYVDVVRAFDVKNGVGELF